MKQSKYDKSKCSKCKWRGKLSFGFCCYYSLSGQSAYRRQGKELIDARGEDYYNCKLFKQGNPTKVQHGKGIIPDEKRQ